MPYRPHVLPTSASRLNAALAGLDVGLEEGRQRRRQSELDDERRDDRDAANRERERIARIQTAGLHERGFREFDEAPTQESELFSGEAPSLSGLRRPQAQPRPDVGADPELLASVAGVRGMGRPMPPPDPFAGAMPGAFVPGHGFAPATAGRPNVGMQSGARRNVQMEDPRYERVTDGLYYDTEQNPEARARAAQEQERSELAEALAGLGHLSREEAQAYAMGAPSGAVRPPQGSDPYGGLTREQFMDDRRELAEIGANAGEDPETAYARTLNRDVLQANLRDRGRSQQDPAFQERYGAITKAIGEPRTPQQQDAVALFAQGKSVDEILRMLDEAKVPDEIYDEISTYLDNYQLTGGA